MKAFNNYDQAKKEAQVRATEKLPAGAYVCKVLGVRYEEGKEGKSDKLILQIDVAEGEYKDFFKKQYDANENEDRKWKGRIQIYVPTDDGSKEDGWTKKSFAGWMDSFEKSNKGYSWDWNENKLKGKILGVVFGETGTVIEGRSVVYTEPRFGVAAEEVRSGKAPQAKFKSRDGYNPASAQGAPAKTTETPEGFMTIPDDAPEDIPF